MIGKTLTLVFGVLFLVLAVSSLVKNSRAKHRRVKMHGWDSVSDRLWSEACDLGHLAVIAGLVTLLCGLSWLIYAL